MSYRLNDPNGSRDDETALNNIQYRTTWENRMKPIIAADMTCRLGEKVVIEDNGIDNSGAPILDDNTVTAVQDWKIVLSSKDVRAEVLVHPKYFPITSFKVEKLKKVKNGDCIIVVKDDHYLLVDYNSAQYLLNNRPIESRASVFGGKESVILQTIEVDALVKFKKIRKYEYQPEAAKLIEPMLKDSFWIGK